MAKLYSDLDIIIPKHIMENASISMKASALTGKVEKYILAIIESILQRYNQTKFTESSYTITKELITTGIKANQKRVFFEDEGLNISNQEEYDRGIGGYKKRFSEKMAEEYGLRCASRGVNVQVNLQYNETGLRIEVVNNSPVIPAEETRLREKMQKSQKYNDIAEFYMENMDNTEGAGLGIALIMILLKNENINPNNFTISTDKDKTIATVEIPFTK